MLLLGDEKKARKINGPMRLTTAAVVGWPQLIGSRWSLVRQSFKIFIAIRHRRLDARQHTCKPARRCVYGKPMAMSCLRPTTLTGSECESLMRSFWHYTRCVNAVKLFVVCIPPADVVMYGHSAPISTQLGSIDCCRNAANDHKGYTNNGK